MCRGPRDLNLSQSKTPDDEPRPPDSVLHVIFVPNRGDGLDTPRRVRWARGQDEGRQG